MLGSIAVILVILWVLGLVTSYTMGGLVHLLLLAAIVVDAIRLLSASSRVGRSWNESRSLLLCRASEAAHDPPAPCFRSPESLNRGMPGSRRGRIR